VSGITGGRAPSLDKGQVQGGVAGMGLVNHPAVLLLHRLDHRDWLEIGDQHEIAPRLGW
jgi:hypothetical protein